MPFTFPSESAFASVGILKQLTAGTFSDASTQNLTATPSYGSSNAAAISEFSMQGSPGLAMASVSALRPWEIS